MVHTTDHGKCLQMINHTYYFYYTTTNIKLGFIDGSVLIYKTQIK